jgi:hypothetical protein
MKKLIVALVWGLSITSGFALHGIAPNSGQVTGPIVHVYAQMDTVALKAYVFMPSGSLRAMASHRDFSWWRMDHRRTGLGIQSRETFHAKNGYSACSVRAPMLKPFHLLHMYAQECRRLLFWKEVRTP